MSMYNKLPRFVYISKEKYFIRTDYRIFIDFEKEMQGKNQKEAVLKVLKRFYPAFLEILSKNLLNEAIDKFIWFYKCGKSKEQIENDNKSNSNVRIYDYDYDSDLIWSAFWDRGIDISYENVHWWKFRALWNTMPSNCEFSKIRGYRAYTGKDKELLELKERYKLPKTEFEIDEEKRRKEIFEQLNKISTSQK